MAVDGLAGDVEGFGDLGDGVAAFAVDAFLVIHLPGHAGLPGGELRLAATGTTTRPGGFQPLEGASSTWVVAWRLG